MPNVNWTWLIIGIIVGWLVVPMAQGFIQSQVSKGE
jgi:hypothetical protein